MSAKTYHPILVQMMVFLDDDYYDNDTVFTQAQLGSLTADSVPLVMVPKGEEVKQCRRHVLLA